MNLFCILIIVLYALAVQATGYDNCDRSLCHYSTQNVACVAKSALCTRCSHDARIFYMSAARRLVAVRKHNLLRGMVARGNLTGFPTAARMATLSWDPELANMAETIVKQCKYSKHFCVNTKRFPNAGYNSAIGKNVIYTVIVVLRRHIQQWFDSYQYATPAAMASYPKNTPIGTKMQPFAQIVHDKTNRLGCIILRQTKNNKTQQYTVCVYNQAPKNKRPVYITGKPTSQCNTGRNPRFPNLCSESENYSAEDMS